MNPLHLSLSDKLGIAIFSNELTSALFKIYNCFFSSPFWSLNNVRTYIPYFYSVSSLNCLVDPSDFQECTNKTLQELIRFSEISSGQSWGMSMMLMGDKSS